LLRLEDVLADVGIDVTCVWDGVIPAAELESRGAEGAYDLMTKYRSRKVAPSNWHLYLLLVPGTHSDEEYSGVIGEQRWGAWVEVDPLWSSGEALHAILHEIGHLLNLPHPWDVYGDTPSAMTYPWRWSDWYWNEAHRYYFDEPGRHHVLRAPESEVRPNR